MRRMPVISLVCALAWPLTGCSDGAPMADGPVSCSNEFDESGVRSAFDAQRQAWNGGDLEGFLAGYERSESFVFTSGGRIRRGYDELAAGFSSRYGEDTSTMGTLAFELVDIRPLGPCRGAAVVLGRWMLTDGQADGAGVFSVILERHDQRWQIVHDHTSSDPETLVGTDAPANVP